MATTNTTKNAPKKTTKAAPIAQINLQKMVLPALVVVLAIALVAALVITIPSANEVEEPAAEKIGYTHYSTDLNVERLEVIAAPDGDVNNREYTAVIYNNEVTMMVDLTAKQYMLLQEGDVVSGHLVAMTDGTAVFTFEGEEDPNNVVCYERHEAIQ